MTKEYNMGFDGFVLKIILPTDFEINGKALILVERIIYYVHFNSNRLE